MADNTFRTYRREPAAQDGAVAPVRGQQLDDPLAELARLIGQGEPVNNPNRAPRHYEAPPLNDPAAGSAWATDERYAEQQEPAQVQYDDRQGQYAERYDAPRPADPDPPYRPAPPSYNADYEQPAADRYAAPDPRYGTDARGSAVADQPRYDDAHDSIQDLPSFLPRPRNDRNDRYDYAESEQGDPDDQSYALEDYEEEEAPTRKRRGFVMVAAVLALVVLGTAGTFAYRTMFGGSMLPSLPPIIKADDAPNKIVPAGNSQTASSGQTNAGNAGSPDKLVSREEKPVDVPAPANTPRVVSTIPIFPDPNARLQSAVAPGTQGGPGQSIPGAIAGGVGAPATLGGTVAAPVYGGSVAPAPAMPLTAGMAGQGAPMQLQQPAAASSGTNGTKKIHTVAIHPGQSGDADAAATAAPPSAPRAVASRPTAAPKPLAAPRGGNAPLSIVPSQGDTAAPARTRTAVARSAASSAAAEPATSAGGGYSVQVSSQRSEAEAQSAYHGLQAKYPSQLGGHASTVRQVNLGDKGVFYRTLVGPYASLEQAAQMCSSLKAAGGSCIVQRN